MLTACSSLLRQKGKKPFRSLRNLKKDLDLVEEGDLNIIMALAEKLRTGLHSFVFGKPFYTSMQERDVLMSFWPSSLVALCLFFIIIVTWQPVLTHEAENVTAFLFCVSISTRSDFIDWLLLLLWAVGVEYISFISCKHNVSVMFLEHLFLSWNYSWTQPFVDGESGFNMVLNWLSCSPKHLQFNLNVIY